MTLTFGRNSSGTTSPLQFTPKENLILCRLALLHEVLRCTAWLIFIVVLCLGSYFGYKLASFDNHRINTLISEVTLTTKATRQTALDERKFLNQTLNPQLTSSLNKFNNTLDSATRLLNTTDAGVAELSPLLKQTTETVAAIMPTLNTATDAIAKLEPVEDNAATFMSGATDTLTAIHGSADGLNKLANDPHIPSMLANLDKTTANVAGISTDGKELADHVTNAVLGPKRWYQKVTGWAKIGAQAVVKYLIP